MLPVKPLDANHVYKRPPGSTDIGDLECTRIRPGHIKTEWRLSEDEIAYIRAGANVKLEILNEPIPPIALNVTEPFCTECMVEMVLNLTGNHDGAPKDSGDYHFQCPDCKRWAK